MLSYRVAGVERAFRDVLHVCNALRVRHVVETVLQCFEEWVVVHPICRPLLPHLLPSCSVRGATQRTLARIRLQESSEHLRRI